MLPAAARDETADELIESLVLKSPAYYVLVTDDKKLSSRLLKLLTSAMPVKEFFVNIHRKSLKSDAKNKKNIVPGNDDINFWLKFKLFWRPIKSRT